MENTIETRRIHFSLLFDWKSDLGQSWRHLRDILGRLGKIFDPSWPTTWVHLGPQDGSWAAQEPPKRSLQNTQEAFWSQEPPKSRPEPSKTPQGGAQTPSKPRFSRKHGGGNAALPRWRSRIKDQGPWTLDLGPWTWHEWPSWKGYRREIKTIRIYYQRSIILYRFYKDTIK